ncbi:MAG: hypothetical protein AAF916_03265 [Planctomycetota bacterium]
MTFLIVQGELNAELADPTAENIQDQRVVRLKPKFGSVLVKQDARFWRHKNDSTELIRQNIHESDASVSSGSSVGSRGSGSLRLGLCRD